MRKTMTLATALVLGVGILYGIGGLLWMCVFAVPIGIVLWFVARGLRWL